VNIIINPTLETTVIDGCEVRQYEGLTEDGLRCYVMVAGIVPIRREDHQPLTDKFNSALEALKQ
jgi:hypothetical protein